MLLEVSQLFDHQQKLPLRHPVDLGYLVHAYLGQTFGEHAPKLFAITRERNPMEVLAYTKADAQTLKSIALQKAPANRKKALDWDSFSTKPMPTHFPEGAHFFFRVRLCPVVRKARGNQRLHRGAEQDLFLGAVEKNEQKKLHRQEVYRTWLADKLSSTKAVRCLEVKIIQMRRSHFVRKNHEGKLVPLRQRPDVTFEGKLLVVDSEKLLHLLQRGIGRHKAFGFGMLLLRR